MRFIAHTFLGRVGLYFVYKLCTRFIFKNINLEPMLRRCVYQNGGLKSNRYESQ